MHYFNVNGRFPVHFMVQLFDGILGKDLFNVLNAMAFIVFLYSLVLVTTSEKKDYFKVISIAFIFVFFLIKGFKHTFLWMSGSFNYLWVSFALLFFHYLINKERVPRWAIVPLVLFSLLCGWSNEAFVVGLGAAYFLYYLTHRKELRGHRIYMLIAFYLGTAFLVFSPGSINRALRGVSVQHWSLMLKFIHMYNVSLVYVLLLLIVYKAFFSKNSFVEWVKKEQVFLIATFVSFCFICLSGAYMDHSRFGIEFFSLIIILRSIEYQRINNMCVLALDVIVLAFAIYIIWACQIYHQSNLKEIDQIKVGNTLVIYVRPNLPGFIDRYALDFSIGFDNVEYGSRLTELLPYFGLDSITFLPKAFIDDLKANPDMYDHTFRSFGKLPFYAKRISSEQTINAATLVYEDPKYRAWPQFLHPVLLRIVGDPPELVGAGFRLVDVAGEKYILVHRTWPDQDKRLKSIILE